jgi:hypothetical protein
MPGPLCRGQIDRALHEACWEIMRTTTNKFKVKLKTPRRAICQSMILENRLMTPAAIELITKEYVFASSMKASIASRQVVMGPEY